jgi:hypothetical protein
MCRELYLLFFDKKSPIGGDLDGLLFGALKVIHAPKESLDVISEHSHTPVAGVTEISPENLALVVVVEDQLLSCSTDGAAGPLRGLVRDAFLFGNLAGNVDALAGRLSAILALGATEAITVLVETIAAAGVEGEMQKTLVFAALFAGFAVFGSILCNLFFRGGELASRVLSLVVATLRSGDASKGAFDESVVHLVVVLRE